MDCFGDEYSFLYDAIYQDKNYSKECDFLAELFSRKPNRQVNRILDFGCGTGNHALELAARGYTVTGVDCSMNMLAAAQRKALQRFSDPSRRPIWQADLPRGIQFDAIVSLFATLNYLDGKSAVLRLFESVRELLSPSGIAVIETWNGTAVPFLFEERREKRVTSRDREILRRTQARLDWRSQVLEVEFTCFEGNETQPRVAEMHHLHYYTAREIEEIAQVAGLRVSEVFPAYQFRRLELNDFSAMYVLEVTR